MRIIKLDGLFFYFFVKPHVITSSHYISFVVFFENPQIFLMSMFSQSLNDNNKHIIYHNNINITLSIVYTKINNINNLFNYVCI